MNDVPITSIKGIGPRRAEALGKLGLSSLKELIYHAPRSYDDFSRETLTLAMEDGENAAIRVTVASPARTLRVKGGLTMTVARAHDGAGKVDLVWYNQPYRAKSVREGESVVACGRADRRRGLKLVNPGLYGELPGIVPVYPVTAGLSQRVMREAVRAAFLAAGAEIEETLPAALMEKYSLMPLYDALKELHFPSSMEAVAEAKRRLAFEDMLLFSLMLSILRRRRVAGGGIRFDTGGTLDAFLSRLPFVLTGAQRRAMEDIRRDMASGARMNRLVQGDVGSGKTAVALYAMHVSLENGRSAAIMAPTEILARQHFALLEKTFPGKACLLVGGMKKRERDAALCRLTSGEAVAVAGTHALLTGDVEIASLGLVIADEQHRFGVKQRAAIARKAEAPDVLIMSATPIPRTLSLIIYGDLDVSVIDELPPGRKKIRTRIVPGEKRDAMYAFIEKEAAAGRQAYAVCPLVGASEAGEGTMDASSLYKELSEKLHIRTALLHGRMSGAAKDEITSRFRAGEIDLLVSTSVVEVGVDVPNATVMAIEGAERFGLAQLHQLRGRVGRGAEESYCFLLTESGGEAARERLEIMTKTLDGFAIANKDLELRGPGEFLGTRQHGDDVYAAARFALDMRALNDARAAADALLEAPGADDNPMVARARAMVASRLETLAVN